MSVSRIHPAIVVSSLLALLSGCAGTGTGTGARPGDTAHLPAPAAKPLIHWPVIHWPFKRTVPPAGSGRGGYYQDDGPGESPPPNLDDVPDALVRAEPYSRYANRPYVVFGKTYTPMLNEQPFFQRGMSSWYGKKFHGQRTSSGELYDMYKMTAAHPTLPIPSYARITSVGNGKQVVVRINDRGPFHSGRIIDVSYTAAVKLGLLQSGSQEVKLERLLPGAGESLATRRRSAEPEDTQEALPGTADVAALILTNKAEIKAGKVHPEAPAVADSAAGASGASSAPAATAMEGFYVQLGAFSRADKAAEIRERIAGNGRVKGTLDVIRSGSLHKVLSGPFPTRAAAQEAARAVPDSLGLRPIVIKR